MAFIGIFFLLVSLAVPVACLAGLVVLWVLVLRRSRKREALSSCGKCGYAVQGLTTFSCPECGSDLRAVGIVTPRSKGMPSPLVFVLLWTLLLPIPSCTLGGLAVAVGPKKTVQRVDLNATPASGNYQHLNLSAVSPASLGRPMQVYVHQSQGGMGELVVNPVTLQFTTTPTYNAGLNWSFHFGPEAPQNGPALTEADVEQWLVNTTMTAADAAAEAGPIFQAIQAAATNPLNLQTTASNLPGFATASASSYSNDEPAIWPFFATLLLCIALYGWGMWVYFRLWQRRVSKVDAEFPGIPTVATPASARDSATPGIPPSGVGTEPQPDSPAGGPPSAEIRG